MKSLRRLSFAIVAGAGLLLCGCQSGPLSTSGFASNLNTANKNSVAKNFRPGKTDSNQSASVAARYAKPFPTQKEIEIYRKQHPTHLAGYQSTAYARNNGSHANCKT